MGNKHITNEINVLLLVSSNGTRVDKRGLLEDLDLSGFVLGHTVTRTNNSHHFVI